MRIIAKFTKGHEVRFVSHLDIQRTVQRAFRRAEIPLAYSQGFNPHPLLSFATALSTGVTSLSEWLDVELARDMDTEEFRRAVNAALPSGFSVTEAISAVPSLPSLTALTREATYTVVINCGADMLKRLEKAADKLISGPIVVLKKTKGGMKNIDMRPMLIAIQFQSVGDVRFIKLTGLLNSAGSLNVDAFMTELFKLADESAEYVVNRDAIVFENGSTEPV